MLENVRFFAGEKGNDIELGKSLGCLGDIYVFDAFGTSHREQASTHAAIVYASTACAGLLLEEEIKSLTKALNQSKNPYTAIIGGAKVSTKLDLIKNINAKADHVVVGGGIANTFIKAAGFEVGQSLYEESMIGTAKELLKSNKIVLPQTVVTALSFEGVSIKEKNINDVEVIANSNGFSIAGGGETLSAINKFINKDDVSYCSTGGGAFLEFMEGKELPSIKALKDKNQ